MRAKHTFNFVCQIFNLKNDIFNKISSLHRMVASRLNYHILCELFSELFIPMRCFFSELFLFVNLCSNVIGAVLYIRHVRRFK